jgi:hypothetical protein
MHVTEPDIKNQPPSLLATSELYFSPNANGTTATGSDGWFGYKPRSLASI